VSDAARLEALEFKLAHLEHTLGALNDVVTRQQRELDEARARLKRVVERLAEWEPPTGASADGYEKPPHY
jgi:SlyX protein